MAITNSQIREWVDAVREADSAIKRIEAELAAAQARREETAQKVLGYLSEQSLPSLTVEGWEAKREDRLSASLPEKAQRQGFFAWLRDAGHGDVIEETVHPSKLSALVRRLDEAATAAVQALGVGIAVRAHLKVAPAKNGR